ncbi:MAG: diacylglycerol kinase family protein [Patescibacteria group bacterium]
MTTLIIFNPVAGVRRRAIKQRLQRALGDLKYEWVDTNAQGTYLEPYQPADYERVVVIGGDGTVHEVAQWILAAGATTTIGIVSAGSGNLLARTLKLPRSTGLALHVALTGTAQAMDVGLINHGRYFLVAAGLGYDAWVIARAKRSWKRLFGFGAYTLALLQGLLHLREENFTLVVDGVRRQYHAKSIFIMNVGTFWGLPLAPDTSAYDGQGTVAVVRPVRWHDYVLMLGRIIGRQWHWEKRLEYHAFKKLKIEYNHRVPFQADGEAVTVKSPLEIDILPSKIFISTP